MNILHTNNTVGLCSSKLVEPAASSRLPALGDRDLTDPAYSMGKIRSIDTTDRVYEL
jgi:hypothetical protein